jgi:hypothetical protein
MAKDRFGEALGLWHIEINESDFDVKLRMGDGRKLRAIIFENTKNKIKMFEMFEDFIFEIIKRDYPQEPEARIKEFVEFNVLKLFEESQVTFRFCTREELAKAKEEARSDLKKLIEAN